MDHAGRPRATDAPAILDALDVVVWQADARTTEFTFVSDGAAHLLGWTPEEANAGAGTVLHLAAPGRPRDGPGGVPRRHGG